MISKNIKYYRLIKSMSKKDLAEAVNVTPMAISNYESGKRKPEIDILKKIANVLGVRVVDFLTVRNENIQFSHNEFRKSSSLPKNTQEYIFESIEEYFSRFMDAVEILGGDVLPNFPKCHYLEITKDVEKDALNLRRYLGFADNGPIDDLIGSLENKGFLVLLKEIDEEPDRLLDLSNKIEKEVSSELLECLRNEKIMILGSGTSYHAGLYAKKWFKAANMIASEFVYDDKEYDNYTFVLLSQSGETFDLIKAIEKIRSGQNNKIISLINKENTTIERLSDFYLILKTQSYLLN